MIFDRSDEPSQKVGFFRGRSMTGTVSSFCLAIQIIFENGTCFKLEWFHSVTKLLLVLVLSSMISSQVYDFFYCFPLSWQNLLFFYSGY